MQPERAAAAFQAFDLEGRVALVTGASSGLGVGIARALAAAGAKVAVTARRLDRLEKLAADIDGLAIARDLLDPGQIDGIADLVAEKFGGLEILVNTAGAFPDIVRAESESADQIQRTMQLNLISPFRLCQQAFPHMVAAGRGSIINVSSISGQVGVPTIPQASYAAAKTGLSGLSAELAVQWARHSIRVNALAPGFFRSEMTSPMYENERSLDFLKRNTPLPYHGTVDDFLGAALWLASDAGRYVTGQTIIVDGGWTAR